MREAVSDIIASRSEPIQGISRMVVLSLLMHGALGTLLVLKPDFLTGPTKAESEPMMISLGGGAEGPENGGVNQLSARPVQEVAPPEARPKAEPQPAPAPPEMTAPAPVAKPATPTKPIEKPAEKTTSKKPTSGAEVKTGSAVAETGSSVQIPFGGLSTSSGGTGGARVDAPNFCCPSYLSTVVQLIKRNWGQNQGTTGMNTVKFVVQRDGRVTDVEIEESAGQLLDIASRRALAVTNKVPPLPREFVGDKLTVHLVFEYTR